MHIQCIMLRLCAVVMSKIFKFFKLLVYFNIEVSSLKKMLLF